MYLGFQCKQFEHQLLLFAWYPAMDKRKRNPGMAVDALAFKQENQKQFAQ